MTTRNRKSQQPSRLTNTRIAGMIERASVDCVQSGELEPVDLSPPVPPGLAKLSTSLTSLAKFLRIDWALIRVAAEPAAKSRTVAGSVNRRDLSAPTAFAGFLLGSVQARHRSQRRRVPAQHPARVLSVHEGVGFAVVRHYRRGAGAADATLDRRGTVLGTRNEVRRGRRSKAIRQSTSRATAVGICRE